MTLPLLVRAATSADLPALVELQNAASPDSPTTLEIQEFRERDRRPELAFGRLVAERSGQVCGVTTFSESEWSADPGRLWAMVTVHPEARRQGVGGALYGALLAEMKPHRPRKLACVVREDRADSLRFAASRGFAEVAREQEAELTLAQMNTFMREEALAQAEAAGYSLLSFGEYLRQVGEDAAWQQYYDLDSDASRDVPLVPGETMQLPTLERYRQRCENKPGFDPSLWFVASRDGALAALSELYRSLVPGQMDTGFTAVSRAHRGHRLAWALKYLALEEAARRGAVTVRTSNDETNMPMRNINIGLGFLPIPAYLTMNLLLPST